MSAPFKYYFSNERPFWEKRRRSLNISRQKGAGANSWGSALLIIDALSSKYSKSLSNVSVSNMGFGINLKASFFIFAEGCSICEDLDTFDLEDNNICGIGNFHHFRLSLECVDLLLRFHFCDFFFIFSKFTSYFLLQ